MVQQYAKASNMSCLLSANKDYELLPEPFRMQSNVVFRVTYSEYINYVLSLSTSSGVHLMTNVDVLSDMAATNQPKLYNCFLMDMAFAIVKELYFAELYCEQASVILPSAFNDNNVHVSNIIKSFSRCPEAQKKLVHTCASLGYGLPANLHGKNAQLFQLAVVLFYLGDNGNIMEEMNLVYDLQ